MRSHDHEKEEKNSYVASMISINSIFVGPIMVFLVVFIRLQVMEIQVEEISPPIGVVETKLFIRLVVINKLSEKFLKRTLHVHGQRCR